MFSIIIFISLFSILYTGKKEAKSITISIVIFLPLTYAYNINSSLYLLLGFKGSNGNLSVFFSRPIGLIIWVLIFASLAFAFYDNRKHHKESANA